ncbi:hypothetical protein ACQP3C_28490, partial [Escherichia coli]
NHSNHRRAEWEEERVQYSISTELLTGIKLAGCGSKLKFHCHKRVIEASSQIICPNVGEGNVFVL